MPSYRRRNAIILDSSSEDESSEESGTWKVNDATHHGHRDQRDSKTSISPSEKEEAILIDSSDEDENGIVDTGIECSMNSLKLGEVTGKRKPFKSQLDALHFDSSCSCSSEEENQEDRERFRKERPIPRQKLSHRARASAIELLDSDSSDISIEMNGPVGAKASVMSPRDSPEVFKMQSPSPSTSSISSAFQEKERNDESSSISSSFSMDNSEDLQSLDEKDTSESAWRRNKYGTFILKGKCLIAGDVQWPKINIPAQLYDKLYDHQKIGVQWLASLHMKGIGGILGDDMGLGK
jgi:SNF2 family DNA or RNA helicase